MKNSVQHSDFRVGHSGSAKPHALYISGGGVGHDKKDVIFVSDGNLPLWAPSATEFFAAADRYERRAYTATHTNKSGEKYTKPFKARAYIEVVLSIPRQIIDPVTWSRLVAQRLLGRDHPYRLAVHSPVAADGGGNPHAHIMFSERVMDGHDRSAEQFFRRPATAFRSGGKTIEPDSSRGGSPKSRRWNQRSCPGEVRRLYLELARQEVPGFAVETSEYPEPKIGPRLPNASKAFEKLRLEREWLVHLMRQSRSAADLNSQAAGRENGGNGDDAALPTELTSRRQREMRWMRFEAEVNYQADRSSIPIENVHLGLRFFEDHLRQLVDGLEESGETPHDLAAAVVLDCEYILETMWDHQESRFRRVADPEPDSPSDEYDTDSPSY